MTTSRQKLGEAEVQSFKSKLNDNLSIKFGDEINDESVIESALYVFDGSTYETSDVTCFIDWQSGRWHVSLQNRTHDYRESELETIVQLINSHFSSV